MSKLFLDCLHYCVDIQIWSSYLNCLSSCLNCPSSCLYGSLVCLNSSIVSKAGFKRLRFPITACHSADGIPLAYINNFIQIWCDALFYGMLCGSNSRRMYLEPHRLLFESYCKKYIWIILLCSNTNDSHSGFHKADYNLRQCHAQRAAWSECISMVCRMAVYSVPSVDTAIVLNQPYSSGV